MEVESARYVVVTGNNGLKKITVDAVIDGVERIGIEPVSEFWSVIESWVDAGNEPEPWVEPEVIPAPLSRSEFWFAALAEGVTKTTLLTSVNQLSAGNRKESLLILINDSQSYAKNDPLVVDMLSLTTLTQEQIDSLWVRA